MRLLESDPAGIDSECTSNRHQPEWISQLTKRHVVCIPCLLPAVLVGVTSTLAPNHEYEYQDEAVMFHILVLGMICNCKSRLEFEVKSI